MRSAQTFREFVRARLPGRLQGRVPRARRRGAPSAFPIDAPAFAKTQAALTDEWGTRGGLHRRRRLDPGHDAAQDRARHGRGAGRLRARRRPHPQPEREVRAEELPPRHPVLGTGARRTVPALAMRRVRMAEPSVAVPGVAATNPQARSGITTCPCAASWRPLPPRPGLQRASARRRPRPRRFGLCEQ